LDIDIETVGLKIRKVPWRFAGISSAPDETGVA
jgi:hypothetical protein